MKEHKKTNRTHKKEHFPNPVTERKRKRLRDFLLVLVQIFGSPKSQPGLGELSHLPHFFFCTFSFGMDCVFFTHV